MYLNPKCFKLWGRAVHRCQDKSAWQLWHTVYVTCCLWWPLTRSMAIRMSIINSRSRPTQRLDHSVLFKPYHWIPIDLTDLYLSYDSSSNNNNNDSLINASYIFEGSGLGVKGCSSQQQQQINIANELKWQCPQLWRRQCTKILFFLFFFETIKG